MTQELVSLLEEHLAPISHQLDELREALSRQTPSDSHDVHVRLIAIGVLRLDEKLELIRAEMAREIQELRETIRLSCAELDRRFRAVEGLREWDGRDPFESLQERLAAGRKAS